MSITGSQYQGAGWPDRHVDSNVWTGWIEGKRETQLTPIQREIHKRLLDRCAPCYVFRHGEHQRAHRVVQVEVLDRVIGCFNLNLLTHEPREVLWVLRALDVELIRRKLLREQRKDYDGFSPAIDRLFTFRREWVQSGI